jgi:hypothetical protein
MSYPSSLKCRNSVPRTLVLGRIGKDEPVPLGRLKIAQDAILGILQLEQTQD